MPPLLGHLNEVGVVYLFYNLIIKRAPLILVVPDRRGEVVLVVLLQAAVRGTYHSAVVRRHPGWAAVAAVPAAGLLEPLLGVLHLHFLEDGRAAVGPEKWLCFRLLCH